MRQDKSSGESIDGWMTRFNQRLASILGAQHIPRAEKKAKAEATMRAVDELMSDLEERLSTAPRDD